MVNNIKGNLIVEFKKMKYDAIIHGCNCFNTMGKGIAKEIRQYFPEAYEADCATRSGDKKKLGTYTSADVMAKVGRPAIVINAYTQYDYRKTYGGSEINVDYDAIERVFTLINKDFAGKKIGIPKIGAGLAGGDWGRISSIINTTTPNVDFELVEFVEFGG
jgi:O-acetyl-ADP-ribose deacetylase (regulator of RNase III)